MSNFNLVLCFYVYIINLVERNIQYILYNILISNTCCIAHTLKSSIFFNLVFTSKPQTHNNIGLATYYKGCASSFVVFNFGQNV